MSDRANIWIPIYIGDYLADTIGLTLSEHGLYLLLIFCYWRKGSPLDDKEAKAIMRDASVTECERIASFFRHASGKWHHKRIDAELAAASENKETRKKCATIASNARWKKEKEASVTHPSRIRQECASPSPSPSPSQEESTKAERESSVASFPSMIEVSTECDMRGFPKAFGEAFWNHFESTGWVDKNNHPIKSWRPKLSTWVSNERSKKEQNNGTYKNGSGKNHSKPDYEKGF